MGSIMDYTVQTKENDDRRPAEWKPSCRRVMPRPSTTRTHISSEHSQQYSGDEGEHPAKTDASPAQAYTKPEEANVHTEAGDRGTSAKSDSPKKQRFDGDAEPLEQAIAASMLESPQSMHNEAGEDDGTDRTD